MLPKNAWHYYEPRFGFPVFKGMGNLVSFSIHPDFKPFVASKIKDDVKARLKQNWKSWFLFPFEYLPFVVRMLQKEIRFRLIITDRKGKYLGTHAVPGTFPPGGSIDVDVSRVIRSLGLPDDDYMAVLVMSNGRHDRFRSSPGTYSMTYFTDTVYTTYRTGGFARALNDPRRKRHQGFRGINPKAVADNEKLSSILLINHSSEPAYDETVHPKATLIRDDGETLEGDFGPIAPFGGVERSLEDLFGARVVDFLAPFGGKGTTIITCPGVTLASIHVMRDRLGRSMSIEHSRPSHTYLLNGVS